MKKCGNNIFDLQYKSNSSKNNIDRLRDSAHFLYKLGVWQSCHPRRKQPSQTCSGR